MQVVELAYFTDNVERMAAFYRDLLGSEPVAHSDSMAIFMAGAVKIFIHRNYTASEGELPPERHTALGVANVDAVCEQLAAAGMRLEVGPRDYYWGRSAYLRDPDGNLIEVTQA